MNTTTDANLIKVYRDGRLFEIPTKPENEIILDIRYLIEKHKDNWVRLLNAKKYHEKYNGYIDWIHYKTPLLDNKKYHIKTKVYWILNNITDFPKCENSKCKHGGKILKNVISVRIGYNSKYCCNGCAQQSDEHQKLMKNIAKEKYNSDSIFGSQFVKAKSKATIEKRILEDPDFWNKRNEKSKITCKKKYGYENPMQNPEIKKRSLEKSKATNRKNLGVDYPFQSKSIHKKIIEHNLSVYGVEYVFQNLDFQRKAEELAWSQDAQSKRIATLSSNFYGITNAFQTQDSIYKAIRSKVENFFEYQNKSDIKLNFTVDEYLSVLLQHKQYETEFSFHCTECGEDFMAIPFEHCFNFSCARCLKCHPLLSFGSSIKEKKVLSFIREVLPNEEIIENDRTQLTNPITNRQLELDIWIPRLRKAIEFNGEYWHYQTESNSHDEIKVEQCKQLGIQLKIVREKDWDNQQNKVKQELKEFLYEIA